MLPLIGNFLLFLVAIAVGVIVMAAIYVLWRGAGAGKPTADQQSVVAVSAVGASASA